MSDVLVNLPTWAGSVPLWALLATVVITLIKVWPSLKQLDQTSEAAIRKELRERIAELREGWRKNHDEFMQFKDEAAAALRQCREECDRETGALHQELLARDRQRIQEQISLISAILNAVGDNPQLTGLLKTFESVQIAVAKNALKGAGEGDDVEGA